LTDAQAIHEELSNRGARRLTDILKRVWKAMQSHVDKCKKCGAATV
jgi:hypothetical protein